MKLIRPDIQKHFDFLNTDFGFKLIPEYGYSREVHNDYIKNDWVVKIAYDGIFWVTLLKAKSGTDLINQDKRTVDYENNYFYRFDLLKLDNNKELYHAMSIDKYPNKYLEYYSILIKRNTEILNNDLRKFSLIYRGLRRLGLIKAVNTVSIIIVVNAVLERLFFN